MPYVAHSFQAEATSDELLGAILSQYATCEMWRVFRWRLLGRLGLCVAIAWVLTAMSLAPPIALDVMGVLASAVSVFVLVVEARGRRRLAGLAAQAHAVTIRLP